MKIEQNEEYIKTINGNTEVIQTKDNIILKVNK